MNVEFDPAAREEIRSAAAYYASQSPELSNDFLNTIDTALRRIEEFPNAAPSQKPGVRRFICPRFPYSIVYRVADVTIKVYAVAHQSRRPGYWRRRLKG